jgi:MATE family multidrug resistance protein
MRDCRQKSTYSGMIVLAGPLILTMSSHMLMQFVDTFLLSRFSTDSMAASMPAGMASWLIISLFHGTAGYTSTLAAHYAGAERADRVALAVWQGIYFAIISGFFVGLCAFGAGPLFSFVGHEKTVQELEKTYFAILCAGAFFSIAGSALSGFFASIHRTSVILIAQIAGAIVNFLLDMALIFGLAGFPRMGLAGAAVATVIGQAAILVVMTLFFFAPPLGKKYHTWRARAFDYDIFMRLVRFGFPGGVRMSVEMIGWTSFLFFIGRIGVVEMATTTIAWRINGIAIFPVVGLSIAAGILVGNAQGRRDPAESIRVTKMGLILSEAWMAFAALAFVLFPRHLLMFFYDSRVMDEHFLGEYIGFGTVLLRFVALYCLVDSFNYIMMGTLQSAGDTGWTLIVSIISFGGFVAVLAIADALHAGFYMYWIICTAFVFVLALVWLGRFFSGKWKYIEVIEEA